MGSQGTVHPIVVAKPLRAREMLTTVIPKEMLDTMRKVSVKPLDGKTPISGTKAKQKEDGAEIYHEGYVEGKLYLVPDSNLQAMRDIINLKMRKKHSSAVKPQTSLDEPTQYDEVSTKLDILLEKVDKLAWISEDEVSTDTSSRKSEDSKVKQVKSDTDQAKDDAEDDLTKEIITIPTKAGDKSKKFEVFDNNAKKSAVTPGSEPDRNGPLGRKSENSEPSESAGSSDMHRFGLTDEARLLKKLKKASKQIISNKISSHESVLESIDKDYLQRTSKESEPPRMNKCLVTGKDVTSETYETYEPSTSVDKSLDGIQDQTHPSKASNKLTEKSDEKILTIPPILNKKIKYKRVKPVKVSLKKEHSLSSTDYLKLCQELKHVNYTPEGKHTDIKHEAIVPIDSLKIHEPPFTTEVFRLLISGHFKHGTTPIFIIQENENGSNVLENHIPDFKSHKKESNIDIFISGKFFTENILEEIQDFPTALNIGPNKILIDGQSKIYNTKFKDVFNLGAIDIVLEGEFLKDKDFSKFTPLLSLEITKPHLKEGFQNTPTTVWFSRNDPTTTPFNSRYLFSDKQPRADGIHEINGQTISKTEKHVHYAEDNEVTTVEELENVQEENDRERKGFVRRIIGNKLYKVLFFIRNIKDVVTNNKQTVELNQSSPILRPKNSRNQREIAAKRRKSNLKGKKTKTSMINRRQQPIVAPVEIYQTDAESKSPFMTRKDTGSETFSYNPKESTNTEYSLKPAKKKKRRDKNQGIVENPILAQMQEFFIT
uniref:Uncharacterized protein n=1 Tax=Graphocephala atropunctata TaxID=36148 RepID=A0A1B6ME30_9HEMI